MRIKKMKTNLKKKVKRNERKNKTIFPSVAMYGFWPQKSFVKKGLN